MFENILAGVSSATGVYNAYQNYQNQKYNKELQSKMFSREDNAIQRRVADLRAAGLSPVLAAGSAADAGPVVKTDAPRMEDVSSNIMSLMKMKADISTTEAQKELIDMQKKKTEMDYVNASWDAQFNKADYEKYKSTGFNINPRNASPFGKIGMEVGGVFGSATKALKGKITPVGQLPDWDKFKELKGWDKATPKQRTLILKEYSDLYKSKN